MNPLSATGDCNMIDRAPPIAYRLFPRESAQKAIERPFNETQSGESPFFLALCRKITIDHN